MTGLANEGYNVLAETLLEEGEALTPLSILQLRYLTAMLEKE
jgi:hypothetical protein